MSRIVIDTFDGIREFIWSRREWSEVDLYASLDACICESVARRADFCEDTYEFGQFFRLYDDKRLRNLIWEYSDAIRHFDHHQVARILNKIEILNAELSELIET